MRAFLKRAWQEVVWTRDYYTTLTAHERSFIPRIEYVQFKLRQQERARISGECLTGRAKALHQVQDSCNHRKGGYANLKTGHISMGTDGGSGGFAVIKHTFAWGDNGAMAYLAGSFPGRRLFCSDHMTQPGQILDCWPYLWPVEVDYYNRFAYLRNREVVCYAKMGGDHFIDQPQASAVTAFLGM